MSLINTNVIDLSAGSVTFTSLEGSTLVESIIFNASTDQITLNPIAGISISGSDFITLQNQVTIFETAILYNFTPGQAFISPFNSFISNEHFITFTNAWSLVCNESGGPNMVSYYTTRSDGMVAIATRANPITIPFSEWMMLLTSLKHYQQSITNFLGL